MVGRKFSLIPKKNEKMIYEYVFKEGVIVVPDKMKSEKHAELDVPNLHVLMKMKSLLSKNLVTTCYNWQQHYYFLTNEGIEYLRDFLHFPATVFPATLTKKSSPKTPGVSQRMERGGDRETNEDWRGGGARGGFGRGRAMRE